MRQALTPLHRNQGGQNLRHAGLILDTGLTAIGNNDNNGEAKKSLLARVKDRSLQTDFQNFLTRWQDALNRLPDTEMKRATTQGRMIIGLGGEAVTETGVTLHRTYGVPYIPGSALKGMAASYARNYLDRSEWGKDSVAYKTIFGYSDDRDAIAEAGYITFHDALPIDCRLRLDTITVHHSKYYQGDDVPPADWDSPIPVPFLATTGTFQVALSGPEEWRKITFDLLAEAFNAIGIGGKTSSGYGRFVFERTSEERRSEAEQSQRKLLRDSAINEVSGLKTQDFANRMGGIYTKWQKYEDDLKEEVASIIFEKLDNYSKHKDHKHRDWYRVFAQILGRPES